jgi:hypothetical protein
MAMSEIPRQRMNTTHASVFICLPSVRSSYTTILAAFARVPMKGGIFFKFGVSELRDEPSSGSLFGSAKIPINERRTVFYFDDPCRANFVDGEMRCRKNMEGND